MNNVILTGFMGSGKSTVGKALAKKLEYDFVDIDTQIENHFGMNINSIFEKVGEQAFRQAETQIFLETLKKNHQVISTGGGIVTQPVNFVALKEAIYLQADANHIYNNLKYDTTRPLLQNGDKFLKIERLLLEREPLYKKCCKKIIQVSQKGVEQILQEVLYYLSSINDEENCDCKRS